MDAVAIAATLRELASYLRLERDAHRARAYDGAASTVAAIHDLDARIAAGTLRELPGIGASTEKLITALHRGEEVELLTRLRERWPPLVVELAQLPKIGVKKARDLVELLAPADLDQLIVMAEAGAIRELPGFGKVSEAQLAAALRTRHERRTRRTLVDARKLAGELVRYLALAPAVREVHVAGDIRRWCEVVGAIVFVAVTDAPAEVQAQLARYPQVTGVEARGDVITGRLADGGQVEVRCARPSHVGAALIVATGSPPHVAKLRARGDLDATPGDERAVYAALGVPWVPPEVRDGDDEVGQAFDDLLTIADVRGAVHCHTTYSDGRNSIAEMAAGAAAHGLAYMTITDHSAAAFYAQGLDGDRLRAQWAELAAVQGTSAVRLIRGTEADILADGQLDVPAGTLGELEVVIASIHQRHKLDEDAMTKRVVTAMRQPCFKIWGHALGRLVLSREPIAVRFDEILDAIVESPAAIEINGDPHRLDLDPVRVRKAKARGARFVVSTDAHSVRGLEDLEYAVAMARRGRLRPADVLNTLPTDEFLAAVRPVR